MATSDLFDQYNLNINTHLTVDMIYILQIDEIFGHYFSVKYLMLS